jgi:hypothetical protein
MTTKNPFLISLFMIALVLAVIGQPVYAQSPNTATILVVVTDPNDALVPDARVSVTNTATGDVREALSGSDGTVTFCALSLTGTYTVNVSREGFGNEERKEITLRSGEIATLKVPLAVGAEKADSSVYGTAEGVHANPQIGLPLRSSPPAPRSPSPSRNRRASPTSL